MLAKFAIKNIESMVWVCCTCLWQCLIYQHWGNDIQWILVLAMGAACLGIGSVECKHSLCVLANIQLMYA